MFFDYYRIDGKVDDYSHIQTFRNPLFLKIFCEAYSETYYSGTERPNIIDIYPKIVNPDVFISLLENNNTTVIEEFHNKLISLKMTDRDLVWSIPANYLHYSISGELERLWEGKCINRQLLLVFECWLLSASYPSVRFPVIRFIVNQLEVLNNPNVVVHLINKFKDVDDPYILQGLCSAIYGYIVRKRLTDMQISSNDDFDLENSINDWLSMPEGQMSSFI